MHSATLLLEFGVVIFSLGIVGRLASWVGLSPIPLYLLAGLAFGQGGVLPLATSESFISVGADIGVILLLLLLGLEYSAEELVGNLRRQAPMGLVNIVVNAAPGVGVGLLLGWHPAAVVAMGGITYASSSGITAKLLNDLGRLGNRETPVVLSLLVLEDLTMAVYLPVLTALLAGAGVVTGSLSIVVALGLVAVILMVALRLSHVINRVVFSTDDEVLLLLVFGLALIVAGLAERVHVSAAVGAFLVGIALSGRVADDARVRLLPLRDLFAAVFFVFFGLRTNPADIPGALPIAVGLVAITAITKGAVGWRAARRAGIAVLGQVRAGTVLTARGEFSIVIAGLVISAGIQPELGTLAASYVLISAVVGPLIARAAEPIARRVLAGRRQRTA
ncbi:MAG: cation:proton antiporter [Mycobacteriales bacterium]